MAFLSVNASFSFAFFLLIGTSLACDAHSCCHAHPDLNDFVSVFAFWWENGYDSDFGSLD